ncbi:MAG: hypothetical protein NC920_01850, partial [Candidatus Omnitrophica bacterium]|nr:hypothetical protein [Candidatus Omnitrophota bacterium]
EVQLRNWLQKFLDSKEDGGVRQGAGTLLAYALRQQGGSEGVVRIKSEIIASQTWEKVLKKEENTYLWEVSGAIISAVMDDVLHTTEVFKANLLNEIYKWYIKEEELPFDYKAFLLYSLLGAMADRRVDGDLKLKFLPLFQELPSQGYSWIGEAGIMQIITDPKIPLSKKEELAQISLKKLEAFQSSGKSLNQLLEENVIQRFDLAILGLVSGQSLYFKAQVSKLLQGLGGVSKEILDFWEDYTVFVAGKGREFSSWEMERLREILKGLPEEWRKTVGVIISVPESRRTFGRSGEFSRVLGAAFYNGGIVIYGDLRELLKEKGKEEANKWFARAVFHEIAHTRHFFGFTIEQLQAFQFYWESVRNNPQRVARDYGLQNLWEYVATLFEDYALDSLGFMAEAKKDAFLLEAFKTVVDTLKYQVKDKWKVRIYRIEGDGKLSWREVDIDKDGLPIIPSDWE